jgi:lysophospholipase L1-like esterase
VGEFSARDDEFVATRRVFPRAKLGWTRGLRAKTAMTEHDSTRSAALAFAFAAVLLSACSGDPVEPDPGTGGAAGSSGAAGAMAGAGAGNAGSGGTAGSAGSAGTGGTVSNGGAAGASGAGMGGLGGSSGAAGATAGGGGSSGSAGSAGASGGGQSGGQGGASGASGAAGAAGGGAGGQAGGGAAGGAGIAGNAGSAGAAGSGGGGFQPCPATGACIILPLGDSITDGVGMNGGGGYRIELFSLATADGHEITYVGSLQNGPQMVDGMTFPRRHEGHSGWKIAQLNPLIPSIAFNPMTPHIVLLHIGTNDIAQNDNLAQAPARLESLIDLVIEEAPDALIAVAQLIPLSIGGGVDAYNDAIPDIVEERADAGKHIILVDQNTDFPLSELPDNVHPNAAGYERMARKWYEAIEPYLR